MPRSAPVDGFRLAYDRHGAGDPVVLLHGWPGDRTDFDAVVPRLEEDAEVVVPDLRGFGASDKHPAPPADAYSATAQARSVLGLLDELDLRYGGVTVRLITITHDHHGLSERDAELARQISAVARGLGVPADPSAVQTVQVTIDALVGAEVMPFWRAVLGYQYRVDSPDEDLVDPHGRGASFWFQQMDAPRPQRNRIHIDVWVPHDQAGARVAAAISVGGRLVTDKHAPSWWVLADAEGNEACIGSWLGRE